MQNQIYIYICVNGYSRLITILFIITEFIDWEINCYRNTSENLRVINGVLAITSIREGYQNKEYTSGYIFTQPEFGSGLIQIRAAMPKGKLLWASMDLTPKTTNNEYRSIRINFHNQQKLVSTGVKYRDKNNINFMYFQPNQNLNDFHIYTIKWNLSNIIWEFDSIQINAIKFNNSDFGTNGFDLDLVSGVGGDSFTTQYNPLPEWECPALIIDYVRYYRWDDNYTISENISIETSLSTDIICSSLRQSEDTTTSYLITSISVTLLVILFILVVVIIIVVKRRTNLRKVEKRVQNDINVVYDDTEYQQYYETINEYENDNSVPEADYYLPIN